MNLATSNRRLLSLAALLAMCGCSHPMTYDQCAQQCGRLGVQALPNNLYDKFCVCKEDKSPGGWREDRDHDGGTITCFRAVVPRPTK